MERWLEPKRCAAEVEQVQKRWPREALQRAYRNAVQSCPAQLQNWAPKPESKKSGLYRSES